MATWIFFQTFVWKRFGTQLNAQTFNLLLAGDSSESAMVRREMRQGKRTNSWPPALQGSKAACFRPPSLWRLPLATEEWVGKLDRQVLPVSITNAQMKWYLISSWNKTLKEAFGAPWVQTLGIQALDTCHQTLKQERLEVLGSKQEDRRKVLLPGLLLAPPSSPPSPTPAVLTSSFSCNAFYN